MQDKTKIAVAVGRAKAIARVIGVGLLAYGLWLSRGHITEVGYAIGLAVFEAETLFVLVDVVALFGKLLTSRLFVAKTRRIGYKLMALGGLLSLAANVAAGVLHGSLGRALYGAGIVAMIVLIEYATVNIKGKTVNTEPRAPRQPKAPEQLTPRQIAARKGAETKRRNAVAPTSPGMAPVQLERV
jgi:hypothetical protein